MEDSFKRVVSKALSDMTETRVSYDKDGKYVWKFETQEIKDLRAKIISARESLDRYLNARMYYRAGEQYETLQVLYITYFDTIEEWLKETVQ